MKFRNIQTILEEDEKIEWSKVSKINKLGKYRKSFIILILLILFIMISPLIVIIIDSNSGSLFDLTSIFFISIAFIAFACFPGFILYKDYNDMQKLLKITHLSKLDLRNFEELTILTNKRWIQQAAYFTNKYVFKDIQNVVKFEGGTASIRLQEISVVYIFINRSKTKFYVNFFHKWEQMREEADFVVVMDEEEFNSFFNALNHLVKVIKEEHDTISYGDVAYYIDFKI